MEFATFEKVEWKESKDGYSLDTDDVNEEEDDENVSREDNCEPYIAFYAL